MLSGPPIARWRGAILALALSHLALAARGAAPPEWRELTPPPAVSNHALLYDHVGDRLLLFGGHRSPAGNPRGELSELWGFGTDDAWRRLRPAASHSFTDPTLVLDTRRNRLVILGNTFLDFCCGPVSRISAIPLTSDMSGIEITGGSHDFVGSVAVYDSTSDRVVTWRAQHWLTTDALTRQFAFTGGGWQTVTTTGSPPPAAIMPEGHLDRALRRMIVVDRAGGGTWTLDLATMAWQSLGNGGLGGGLGAMATGLDVAAQRLLAATPSGVVYERPLAPVADWQVLATGPPAPAGVADKKAAWDASGMRFLFHGGVLNEVWELSLLPDPLWTLLASPRPPVPWAIGNSLTVDTQRGNVLLGTGFITYTRGPMCGSSSFVIDKEYRRANWSLAPTPTGADWQLLTQPGGGNWGRWAYASSVYDPGRDRVLYFGGSAFFFVGCTHGGEYGMHECVNEGFAVDMGPAHTIVPFDTLTTPPPRARFAHGAVWDGPRDRMLVAGGYDIGYTALSELWQLDGATLRWLPLATTGTPPVGGLTLLFDAERDRLIATPTSRTGNDPVNPWLYFLDLATMNWTRVQPTGGPLPKWIASALDPGGDRLLVLAVDPTDLRGALWQIPLSGPPVMSKLSYPRTPPFTNEATAVFDPVRGRLIVHGGMSESPPVAGGQMRSTWMLQLDQPTATDIELAAVEAMRDRVRIVIQATAPGQAFEIERRAGDGEWTTRANVSADGTGRASFEDREVTAGGLYAYRVSWWDGGTRRTSAVREVRIPGDIPVSLALDPPHPNPASGSITFSLSVPRPGPVELTVQDVLGRIVRRERVVFGESGRVQHQLALGALRPGVYLLQARSDAGVLTRRFLVTR